MKLKKTFHYQCVATVQPGEYTITRWDNLQCQETNPRQMVRCEYCSGYYCYMHWPKHECHMSPSVQPLY